MTQPQSVEIPRTTFFAPLAIMKKEGVPINSIIDIGCADGTFALQCLEIFGRNMTLFNIDAQHEYEPSLKKIQEKVGGYYKISAVSVYNGQMRFGVAPHPYWVAAGGGEEHQYIECRTLDSLLGEIELPAPYFIKMDIEHGEFSALQGATITLEQTAGVLLETNIFGGNRSGTFLDIYNFLGARNFSLFDMTNFGYRQTDQATYQIYTTFLNKNYEFRNKQGITGSQKAADDLKGAMVRRRQELIAKNEQILSRF
ncbi:FkbM family methyltransferase [Desulfococcaceae bacterium HSG8]|nr:FkbM family methyltransferase [Desulfococcaceae bacterium HSG8]